MSPATLRLKASELARSIRSLDKGQLKTFARWQKMLGRKLDRPGLSFARPTEKHPSPPYLETDEHEVTTLGTARPELRPNFRVFPLSPKPR